jgi:hypothetical protein
MYYTRVRGPRPLMAGVRQFQKPDVHLSLLLLSTLIQSKRQISMHHFKVITQIILILLIIPWFLILRLGKHKALVQYRKEHSPVCHYIVIYSIVAIGLYVLFALAHEWLKWEIFHYDTISIAFYAMVIWLIINDVVFWLLNRSSIPKTA